MACFDYDLFVIGAGSGGVRAARMAAKHGIKVAVAENRHVGGTCVNVGCVPKKLYVYASEFAESFKAASGYGWQLQEAEFDWARLVDRKNQEINRLQGIYNHLLDQSKVDLIEGTATVVDAHSIKINEQTLSCRRILITTGSKAFVPDIPGNELAMTSDDLFTLSELPKRMLIIGGGYIAVEFACILHGLGVDITLCYRGSALLRGFDLAVSEFLAEQMLAKGIKIELTTEIQAISRNESGLTVSIVQGYNYVTDQVLYATGRIPNTQNLGLQEAGVNLSEEAIPVNELFQSNIKSIYALGDVTGRVMLTPVAIAEAMVWVNQHYGDASQKMDYHLIPTAVFSQPNVATVGLNEQQALDQNQDIDIYQSVFTPLKHSLSGIEEKTLMKMIVNRSTDKVLGVHMVGPEAGEIIQGLAIALQANATKAQFDATIGIHPTLAEEFVTMRVPINLKR